MPRSNIKYELAEDDEETYDYFIQHAPEHQPATRKTLFWNKLMQTITLIAVYFVLSIGLTFYQKWLYGTYKFNYPLSVICVHLVLKFILAGLIRSLRKCSKHQQVCRLSCQTIVWTLSLPGIASGLDIGFSNWGMSLVTMSLYTMTKSTTIIFILGFALLFGLEKKSWLLAGIVSMISCGLIMFTYESVDFNLIGFILCLLASLTSGVRWTMAQMIMQKSKIGLRNPIDMMYYMQPWMLLSIFPVAVAMESSEVYKALQKYDWNDSTLIVTVTYVLSGGLLAFMMEVMEFLVVTYTSSLTLSIAGIFKEISIVVIAYEYRGDKISGLNFVGLLMCLGGITLHVVHKIMINKKESCKELELQSNSLTTTCLKSQDTNDTNFPLIMQKSSSLTNLLNANFSSDEEEDQFTKENSKQLLSDIIQRRE
ncbi:solute carrier family 35 member C2 [Phymastichus coffea]|uniref:solute carrier family 35 member C2 n=1 Tax=Phymastichus coffea TaxID=108790 RepID=UPI00273CDA51|nr:solute carrier family 35 member C2 [Phymastichus coffea]XP_058798470.1 solute carrier family 35 member C2 [Phymastichus coffea]XP_058798471.1 solute carrier family 35 member C2 [Phymastichus coffea]XP_058798472.1 solute carrier family 35 member C2 [Phymastichus coffea]XP_058798473.1 solute carrier family 35 member C2 [Phymastichus coffea]